MTSEDGSVLKSERDGDLLTLTLNRPGQANALSPTLVENLIAAIESADSVRLCVIRGEGRHFCAGFDLSDLEDVSDGDLLWRFLRIEELLQTVHHAPFPVLVLAHGQVVGAGADLFAAACHRIAAPGAKFRMPGWNFELALGTRRLTRLIGTDAARDMLIDTKVLTADQASDVGLANAVVDVDGWQDAITGLLERSRALPDGALSDMLTLTAHDSRDADTAAIVKTAGRPGLKHRVQAYRSKVLSKS